MSIRFPKFDAVPKLRYGFSERSDGNMRLPADETVKANRDRYLGSKDLASERLVAASLVHGTHVHVSKNDDAGKVIQACDGLITHEQNLALGLTGADCFPIFAVDPQKKIIGLAHAGWRGITHGVVSELVSQMKLLDSHPENLLIGIGPGLRACHFEIKEDVLQSFTAYPESILNRDGKLFVDLPSIIRQQLEATGIQPSSIEDCGECTYDLEEKYFSWRRDKGVQLQAMLAYIILD